MSKLSKKTLENIELGALAFKSGNYEVAENAFRAALKSNKRDATIRLNLGLTLQQLEFIDEAAEEYSQALAIKPSLEKAALLLSSLLRRFNIEKPECLNPTGVIAALKIDSIEKQPIVETAIKSIMKNDDIAKTINKIKNSESCEAVENLIEKKTTPSFKDNLFLEALTYGKNLDPYFEELLRRTRQYILQNISSDRIKEDRDFFPLILSLISQCEQNQYVWNITQSEKEALSNIQINKEELLSNNIEETWKLLKQLLYKPYLDTIISDLDISQIAKLKPKPLANFLTELIENREYESKLSQTIASLSSIADETSHKVSKQYEKSPYPQWTSLHMSAPGTARKALTPYFQPKQLEFMDGDFDVLIAGCGTGQHAARAASLYGEKAKITAIDISMPSLAYAKRMAKKYNIQNIEFIHADILELEKLNQKFDIIESIGVLHHMAEPFKGWKILSENLKPSGLMYIGLYSQISRKNIFALRNETNYPGPGCSNDQARAYRADIKARKDGELGSELHISEDFYALHEFRDLVLHESEQHISIPEIKVFLEDNKLEFKGFTLDPIILQEFQSKFSEDQLPGLLDNWQTMETEQTNLFDGMYLLWCEKIQN